jgi:hypothetical protein
VCLRMKSSSCRFVMPGQSRVGKEDCAQGDNDDLNGAREFSKYRSTTYHPGKACFLTFGRMPSRSTCRALVVELYARGNCDDIPKRHPYPGTPGSKERTLGKANYFKELIFSSFFGSAKGRETNQG